MLSLNLPDICGVHFCRMNFNQAEEEYIDGEDTIGLGTLGKEGSGRCADYTNMTC